MLCGINLTIAKNSITGIIGPNGAGKSTLIKIITGFEFPDTGSIHVNGIKIRNFVQIKNQISYMPEEMSLYPDYFVGEFLEFYHSITNFRDTKLFNRLSLNEVLKKKIKHLSKGWHQRIKLYTALSNKKEIVVLDEPFDGFDPLQMREISDIFNEQNKSGRSFILSIHQLSYAQNICNNFIFLNRGVVIAEGSLKTLAEENSVEDKNLETLFLRILKK